jgi:uncharacterized protein YbjT (DUF2867 family)
MKVIITGATGMVGKGVLLECLESDEVNKVLSISRRSLEMDHPKLKEVILPDFTDFSSAREELAKYDACFHCMGVSAAGLDETTYTKLTYDISLSLAKELMALNPQMTFIYVSGQGTDSSEKGRSMWARVKGKTENDLLSLGFHQAFMFRPGGIIPKKGVQPSSKLYRVLIRSLSWLIHLIKIIAPNSVVDTTQVGKAMISASISGYDKLIINPVDIITLAKKLDDSTE